MFSKIFVGVVVSSLFSVVSLHAHSADIKFFKNESSLSTADQKSAAKKFGASTKVVGRGKVDVAQMFKVRKGERVNLSVLGKKLNLNVKNIVKKSDKRTAYSSQSADGLSFLNLAENNGKIVGSMMVDNVLYKVRPEQGSTNTLIIEVQNNTLIDHDESYTEDYNPNIMDTYSPVVNPAATSSDSGSEITVIVAYTAAFKAAAGDINAYMDLLELETNTTFINSNVNARVNLIYSYQTGYTDSKDFYVDRSYFDNTSNNYSSQLRQLRDSRKADVMMVLTGPGYNFCGIANQIGSTAETALALASENCATGYYSFAHEIGHLMGARHIMNNDPSVTPYQYGHGYCNSNQWRTVMGYSCPNGDGPRIQQWSNPYVSIAGKATGTTTYENNARVWNVRAGTVSSFRSGSPNDLLSGHGTTSNVYVKNKWGNPQELWAEAYYANVKATADQYCDYLGYTHAASYTATKCGEDESSYMRFNPSKFVWEYRDSGSKNRCYKLLSSVNCSL